MNTMNATPNVPSISSSAVLIDLSISAWTGRKKDKHASDKVTTDANASKGAANVIKKLLGDCAELDAVQKFAANARNTHYAMTMPWSDLGMRLCPTPLYMGTPGKRDGYQVVMGELQNEFFRLVEVFLQAYNWEMQNAQLKLGALFNPDEYPTVDSLRDKFKFRFVAVPLPEAGDWRLDIGNEAAASMREQYETFYGEQLRGAMNDIWQRVQDAVTRLVRQLDGDGRIYDSSVHAMHDLIDLMGTCNMTGDPQMLATQRKLYDALDGVTPDALREDEALRAVTKQRVDEVKQIINNLPGLGF